MIEIWKPIKDFENIYEISNLGKVRNIKKNKIKETWIDNFGYVCVSLYKNNKKYNRKLARLLAETFIPNPENKPTVDHIDRNKLNNDLSNLRWADYTLQNKNRKIGHINGKREQKVICIDTGKIFNSITEASNYYNISIASINMCCRGKTKTSNKLMWQYYEEKEVE